MDHHQLCNKTTHFVVLLCCRTKKQPANTKINVQLSITKNPLQMHKKTNKRVGNANKVKFFYMNINGNLKIVLVPSTVYQKSFVHFSDRVRYW